MLQLQPLIQPLIYAIYGLQTQHTTINGSETSSVLRAYHASLYERWQCIRYICPRIIASQQRCKKSEASRGSSSEILKDIYGNRAEGFYEFGLAEATDKSDFDIKLFSPKEKWESLCPGFHGWFKRRKVMIFWLALFRMQEREPMFNSCTFKTT